MLIYDWLIRESEDNACGPLIKFESAIHLNQRSTLNLKIAKLPLLDVLIDLNNLNQLNQIKFTTLEIIMIKLK